MKIKCQFYYENIKLLLIQREEPYLNSGATVTLHRVIAPNGEALPINFKHKQTLKSMREDTYALLDSFKARGADVKKELTTGAMTKEELQTEVQELTDALKESDTELRSAQEDLADLKKEYDSGREDLEIEISELKERVLIPKTLEDEIKCELFTEHFDKINLIDFERFIKLLDLY